MAFVPFPIPPGVVRPATPLQARGRYWDANLIRWRSGKLLPVGGWQRVNATPLSSVARTIFPWSGDDDAPFAAIGCEDKMYVLDGSLATYTDITPPSFVGPSTGVEGGYGASTYGSLLYGDDTGRPVNPFFLPTFSWTADNWGVNLVAVASSDGRFLCWDENDPVMHQVGKRNIVTIVRATNVVTVTTDLESDFTAGDSIVIAGVTNPAFNGTFTAATTPSPTTFTYPDSGPAATSSGGTAQNTTVLINNTGVIVTPERHVVLIGADGNPRRVAWSGAEDLAEWDFADPASESGFFDLETQSKIIMCAPVREGTLIWTEDEAWLMRYIGLPYIYGFERIGYGCGLMSPRSFATTAGRCIWMGREGFWIYDGGYVKPLPCGVGSYVFDDIDPTAGALYSHGSENNAFPEVWFWFPEDGSDVPNKYVIYNYMEGWWSIGSMTRTAAAGSGVFPYPIAADTSNYLYYHENGWTNAGAPLVGQRYAESGAINVSNGAAVSTLRQAMTDSGYGYDSTNLTLYAKFTPEGAETTLGPYSPRADGYTDIRGTGRDFRIRIGATQDAEWSIGEMRVDAAARGQR